MSEVLMYPKPQRSIQAKGAKGGGFVVRFITGTKHTPGESDEALLRGAVRAALAAADKVSTDWGILYHDRPDSLTLLTRWTEGSASPH